MLEQSTVFLSAICDMNTARAPKEDVRYTNTPNWAILYIEVGHSQLRMVSTSLPANKRITCFYYL
jgi:hypothetical protein